MGEEAIKAYASYDGKRLPLPSNTPVDASIAKELGFKYTPTLVGPPYWPYTYKPWDCARLTHTQAGIIDLFRPPRLEAVIQLYKPTTPGSKRMPWPPPPAASRATKPGTAPRQAIPELVVDVAVIGGGLAGLASAEALSEHGLSVAIVDFGLEPGGYLGGLWSPSELDPSKSSAELVSALHAKLSTTKGVRMLQGWEFIRPWGRALLLKGAKGYLALKARSLVMATGGIDQRPLFPGNWLPGIVSSDYAVRLTSWHGLRFRTAVVIGWNEWTLRLAGQMAAKYADRVVIVSKKRLPEGIRYMDYASQFGVELVVDRIVKAESTPEGVRLRFREYEDITADIIVSTIGPYPEPLTAAMLGASLAYSETLKAVIPRVSEDFSISDGVFAAGLVVGEVSEYSVYHGGRLAGKAAAAYLGKADESDVKAESVNLMRDPLMADVILEFRQGSQAAPPSEPEAFIGPGIAKGEYIDVCSKIELVTLDASLRRFRDLGATVDELGLFSGLDAGREALQTLIQFASMTLGMQPSQLPLKELPAPFTASPLPLSELALRP